MDAERYVRARPRVHDTALDKFRAFARVDTPFASALDIGCGTGHSTIALAAVATSVIGIDPSAQMLAHAVPHPRVSYRQASAEQVPLPDGSFDIITAALAFHWFDADAFLAESSRLLRVPGWLVIYTSGFTGTIVEDATFPGWFKAFSSRFPTPPRNRVVLTDAIAAAHRFRLCGEESFSNDVPMSAGTFVDYELSTTNIIAATERGETTPAEAEVWMRESIAPFFGSSPQRTFQFAGTITYLAKQDLLERNTCH